MSYWLWCLRVLLSTFFSAESRTSVNRYDLMGRTRFTVRVISTAAHSAQHLYWCYIQMIYKWWMSYILHLNQIENQCTFPSLPITALLVSCTYIWYPRLQATATFLTTLQHELIPYELQTQDSRPCTEADVDTFHPVTSDLSNNRPLNRRQSVDHMPTLGTSYWYGQISPDPG